MLTLNQRFIKVSYAGMTISNPRILTILQYDLPPPLRKVPIDESNKKPKFPSE